LFATLFWASTFKSTGFTIYTYLQEKKIQQNIIYADEVERAKRFLWASARSTAINSNNTGASALLHKSWELMCNKQTNKRTNKQTSYQGYDAPLQSYTFKKKKEIRQETKTVIIIKIQISKIYIYIRKEIGKSWNREKLA